MRRNIGILAAAAVLVPAFGCIVERREPGPPAHARAYGLRRQYRYVYYPSCFVYFDIERKIYFYREGDIWRSSQHLPAGIAIPSGEGVPLELDTDTPHIHFNDHQKNYPPGQIKAKETGPGKDKGRENEVKTDNKSPEKEPAKGKSGDAAAGQDKGKSSEAKEAKEDKKSQGKDKAKDPAAEPGKGKVKEPKADEKSPEKEPGKGKVKEPDADPGKGKAKEPKADEKSPEKDEPGKGKAKEPSADPGNGTDNDAKPKNSGKGKDKAKGKP